MKWNPELHSKLVACNLSLGRAVEANLGACALSSLRISGTQALQVQNTLRCVGCLGCRLRLQAPHSRLQCCLSLLQAGHACLLGADLLLQSGLACASQDWVACSTILLICQM